MLLLASFAHSNDSAKRLFDDLMKHYNKVRRPGPHNRVIVIKMKLRLSQIIDVVCSQTYNQAKCVLFSTKRTK